MIEASDILAEIHEKYLYGFPDDIKDTLVQDKVFKSYFWQYYHVLIRIEDLEDELTKLALDEDNIVEYSLANKLRINDKRDSIKRKLAPLLGEKLELEEKLFERLLFCLRRKFRDLKNLFTVYIDPWFEYINSEQFSKILEEP